MLRVQFERLQAKLSQGALAQLAGLTQPEVSVIETGRLEPTSQQLNALARALKVAPAHLLLKSLRVADPEESVAQESES